MIGTAFSRKAAQEGHSQEGYRRQGSDSDSGLTQSFLRSLPAEGHPVTNGNPVGPTKSAVTSSSPAPRPESADPFFPGSWDTADR
jgi:hypothetical protein